ncbi:cuticle protein 16.5-like [Artemia franciscana]|uniref:cuticle protein 16.5-like n=1 Tax=Artemia franciscana TaxID=6661 RepID=UPI0032DA658E
MDSSMLQASAVAGGAAGLVGGSAGVDSQTGSAVSLGANGAGSMMSPAGVLAPFPMGGFPTGMAPFNGAFPGFGQQFSFPQGIEGQEAVEEEEDEELFVTKIYKKLPLLLIALPLALAVVVVVVVVVVNTVVVPVVVAVPTLFPKLAKAILRKKLARRPYSYPKSKNYQYTPAIEYEPPKVEAAYPATSYNDSYEAPYTPKPTYSAPAPVYFKPRPTYAPPAPAYPTAKPTYAAPAPSYSAPVYAATAKYKRHVAQPAVTPQQMESMEPIARLLQK